MDKKMFIIMVSATAVLLAITAVTAYNRSTNTPLYTVRMEQASSKMNFLPTAVKGFTYTAEKGYTLNYDVGYFNVIPLEPPTNYQTCPETICGSTCETCQTCPATCPDTCPATCRYTCDDPTCPATCPYTCDDPTCPNTCPATCPDTCDGPTCPSTCDDPTCYVTSCGEYTCSGPKCDK